MAAVAGAGAGAGEAESGGLPLKSYWIVFPLSFGVIISGYFLYRMFTSQIGKNGRVNKVINKDVAQVVDSFDIEDLGDKTAFCRCWRSDKFPYCDGAHVKHNLETGDNVGPLILTKFL